MSLLLTSAALSLLAVLAVWLTGRRDPAQSPLLTLGSLLTLLALPFLNDLALAAAVYLKRRGWGHPRSGIRYYNIRAKKREQERHMVREKHAPKKTQTTQKKLRLV